MAPGNRRHTRLQCAAAAAAVAGLDAWRWLSPRLATMARRGRWRLGWVGRWVLGHRRFVVGLGVRIAWWSGLALLIWGSRTLVALAPDVGGLPPQAALQAFAMGLALCGIGVMLAPSRSVRWLSSAQGLAHAWCGLVAWISLGS